VPIALDSPSYLGERLSDNIAKTPEGYRICRNAVIGRSGFQTYIVSELDDPDGLVKDRNKNEEVQVWRDPSEVFDPATLASFEGKTFTVTHPEELLDPDSEQKHHAGHAQNIRKGPEPLPDGNWPMLADLIVTSADAILAVDRGERQLSCGYSYILKKTGERLDQTNIVGNHIALVDRARAGADARINDSAPKEHKVKNIVKHILGLGLNSYAKDATPEELAEASRSVARDAEGEEKPKEEEKKEESKDAGMDRRKRLHDALDRQLEAEDRKNSHDADIEDLKKLLGAKDESEEEEKKAEEKDAEGEESEVKPIEDAEGEEEEKEESEDSEIVRPEPDLPAGDRPKSQFDSAIKVLKAMRPFIAKTHDKKLHAAFDTIVRSTNAAARQQKSGGGDYGQFLTAARTSRGKDSSAETPAQESTRRFQEVYNKARKDRTAKK